MNSSLKSFLIFILAVFFPYLLFGGTTGKITGVVKDKETGEPLIGVNIVLEGTVLGATTDLDGTYLILNVPPGKYTLVAQYIGYKDVRISEVEVSVDFTTRIDIEMEPTALELGETIEVVAEREVIKKDLTATQAEVSAEEIRRLPAEEFRDVLQLKAGITRDEFGGFHIRGGRSSEVAFWVDGISVTDAFDGSVAVEVENNAIQSLQVISGTFNAEYGQAMSGIINIVTKEGGDRISGEVSSYVGDYISRDKDTFLNIDHVSPSDIYDFRFSLNGPIPFMGNKVKFFTNIRRNYNDGWLYGQRRWLAWGDTLMVNGRVQGTPGDSAIVPMNYRSWFSTQNKVTFQITPLLKIGASFNYDKTRFREYDHFYKYNPDGDFKRFQWGYNGTLTVDHTLSKTTFYTLKFAQFSKRYQQYVYKDDNDSRYVDNSLYNVPAFNFSIGGQKNQHFTRETRTNIFKFDLTSQVSKRHLVKTGVEFRQHRLYYEDYNIIDLYPEDPFVFQATRPDTLNPNYNRYIYRPIEFSYYIQDKMEYDDFIINIGVRFDYFNSRGRVLADPKDPSYFTPLKPEHQQMSLEERKRIWFKKASPKYQLSPRVGVAYPISATGVIHFSYGHFLQIPEFQYLYQNPSFRISRSVNNLLGNADLDAQRTVMYEIGLQQQLGEVIGIDVTGFYRDIRNWVGTSPLKQTYATDIFYSQYENRDYANVRGITVSVRKNYSNHFAANLDYTMQVAEGNASNPTDAYNDILAGREPRKLVIPLAWDRTHVLNGNIYLDVAGFGISLLGRFETGLPYTPEPVQGTRTGANLQKGLQENSGRRPNLVTFDLQINRQFSMKFGNRRLNYRIFAKIYNLFDRRNEQGVYTDTGRATYTLRYRVSGETADPTYIIQPAFYTEPRQVQLGMAIGF